MADGDGAAATPESTRRDGAGGGTTTGRLEEETLTLGSLALKGSWGQPNRILHNFQNSQNLRLRVQEMPLPGMSSGQKSE